MLQPETYYEFGTSGVVKCGACWNEDLRKTQSGEYLNDECVLENDLNEVPDQDVPLQCDECGAQNEAYDAEGELP